MNLWRALQRLILAFAALGLLLAPMAASAAAGRMGSPMAIGHHAMADHGMADHGMAGMADRPCCPPGDPAMPDCAKGCPLMALCLAKVASVLPDVIVLPVRASVAAGAAWAGEAPLDSVSRTPPPEPPRA